MSDRETVSERDREQRLARLRAAADAWVEIYADATPRRVEIACPTCGCVQVYHIRPPDEPRESRHDFDVPLPIVEGVSRECINCILYPPAHAPG